MAKEIYNNIDEYLTEDKWLHLKNLINMLRESYETPEIFDFFYENVFILD